MAKLTAKQEQFCREYIIDLNATQAAIRAGYSEDTAKQMGSENLSKPDIENRIQELMAERSERTQVSADKVIKELAKLGFRDPSKFYRVNGDGLPEIDMTDVDEDDWAAVAEVHNKVQIDKDGNETRDVRVKLADKKAALDSLGRHLGLFTDKLEVRDLNKDFVGKVIEGLRKGAEAKGISKEDVDEIMAGIEIPDEWMK